jgi:hypothetical protein
MKFMRKMMMALAAAMTLSAVPAQAQLGGIGGLQDILRGRTPNLLGDRQPITTSLPDARWGRADMDGFEPRQARRSMFELQRTPNGGFVVQSGYWSYEAQSYCLKAGTHGPGDGDGYLFAPPKGPAEDAVMTIVRNSVNRPEIPQMDIQQLLWAIIARAKFEDLSPRLRAVASQLLTPRQLSQLNRSALDVLSSPVLSRALGGIPEPLRQIAQAEAQLRQMLTTTGTSFAEMERVAVLSGNAPLGAGSQTVPSGRWSLHPDGYYIRYVPAAYSRTRIDIWAPQGSPAVGKEFDPAAHIAVPGNTSRQRLIQSGRGHQMR